MLKCFNYDNSFFLIRCQLEWRGTKWCTFSWHNILNKSGQDLTQMHDHNAHGQEGRTRAEQTKFELEAFGARYSGEQTVLLFY